MKNNHAIVVAALLFITGCETTRNASASGSTTNNPGAGTTAAVSGTSATGTTSVPAGTSTSGNNNPAMTATNARGTLTEGSTAVTGTTNSINTSGAVITTTTANNNTESTQIVNAPPAMTANASTANQATAGVNNMNSANTAGAFSVPATYQSSFIARYPGATNVQWSRFSKADMPIDWDLTDWSKLGDNDYVVRYNVGNDPHYSWYDSQGNWIGTTGGVKNTTSLPSAINTVLTTKYRGYTIANANMQSWKDRTAYEIELKNSTSVVRLLIDPNGNVIREKTKIQ